MYRKLTRILLPLLFIAMLAHAQQVVTVSGKVSDAETSKGLEGAAVYIHATKQTVLTGTGGAFTFTADLSRNKKLTVTFLGYQIKEFLITDSLLDIRLQAKSQQIGEVVIEDVQSRRSAMKRIDPRLATTLPSINNSIEALIKTLPGVSSNNEMSSQYNVRGGNYDENLIYVNDIEIYRPFLVRSGQQEGLSFINPDMVSSVLFSAGGFEARYGDKMASVLDVQYRRPKQFSGTVMGSMLDGSVQLEGSSKDKRFTWIGGLRHRSNQYVLKSLDTQGDYKPSFSDGQLLMAYDFTPEFTLEVLGNYARNKYAMVPESRVASFGTVKEAKQVKIYFDGQEIDEFETFLGAVSAIYKPNRDTRLKLIASGFRSSESETFDISGEYFIGSLETDFAKDNFGSVVSVENVGADVRHARNYLNSTVYSFSHVGYHRSLSWGAKYQKELISDKLSEWRLIDSADYSIPLGNPTTIDLDQVIKQKINLDSERLTSYLQNTWSWGDSADYSFTLGGRANYWTLNEDLVLSPRGNFSVVPNWKQDFLFRFSTGYYYQPPFYRELRDFNGNINYNLKAQTSIHFVLGTDYNFRAWNRPFKFIGEVYYKYLDNLVPYEIDNVRLRYYAQNLARGYAQGIDMKVNGEFIKGVESWMSLSVMQTQEDIKNDFYYVRYNSDGDKIIPGYTTNNIATDSSRVEPGYIPRPTDQRFNFAIFFQDYIPRFPSFRVNLNLVIGAPLPFGPPSYERYKDTLRMPPYRRVDIGFTKVLKSEEKELSAKNPFHRFKSIWLAVEVFNLLGINNTISYLWVKDITNRQYAVPNYLTNRRINVKLVARF